mgnify:CR=1 FL=1
MESSNVSEKELDMPRLSIVATLYQSEAYIVEFLDRIQEAAKKCLLNQSDYEIVLVDDGSKDKSLSICLAEIPKRKNIQIIELSRNFGHHKAMLEGLSQCKGELVFLIDIDLEEEPELLILFYNEMRKIGADVVYGVQRSRKGSSFERITGAIFYRIFNLVSDLRIPENSSTARLMTRQYVDALLCFKEAEVFIGGLWYLAGFIQHAVHINKTNTSPTTYTFTRRLEIFAEAILSFSVKPLYILFYFSFFISSAMVTMSAYIFIRYIAGISALTGWTSLMVVLTLSASLLFACNSIFALYLAKIYSEAKRRPRALIRRVYSY